MGVPALGCDAVVLAGGEGTRLRPVVGPRAKILADVGGLPLLSYLIRYLHQEGILRIVLALGHFHQQILDHLSNRDEFGPSIVPVVETRPLGTGGAIRHALDSVLSDPLLILNGDTLTRLSLSDFVSFHDRCGAEVTIATTDAGTTGGVGQLQMSEDGRVSRFEEKGTGQLACSSAGFYLASRQVIEALPHGDTFSWEYDVLPRLVGKGLYAYRGDFDFLDIGTPESYQKAPAFVDRHDH